MRISVTCTTGETSIGKPFPVTLTLENTGVARINGGVLTVDGNKYFQSTSVRFGAIATGQSVSVDVSIPIYSLLSWADVPEQLVVNCTFDKKTEQTCFSLSFGTFAGEIKDYVSPSGEPLKIVLFGIQGACKSSTINSWYKMLKQDIHFQIANEGAHYGATTVEIVPYKASQWPNFILVDTWGETLNNYRASEFMSIISGTMPCKSHMTLGAQGGPKIGVPDCVVFFTTVQAVDEPQWTNKLAQHIDDVTAKGIPFVVVLTKVDEIDPVLETNPDARSATLEAYKVKLAKNIGMAVYKIDHIVNYHGSTPTPTPTPAPTLLWHSYKQKQTEPIINDQLNFNKDRHAYQVMRKVLDAAMQHARSSVRAPSGIVEF